MADRTLKLGSSAGSEEFIQRGGVALEVGADKATAPGELAIRSGE